MGHSVEMGVDFNCIYDQFDRDIKSQLILLTVINLQLMVRIRSLMFMVRRMPEELLIVIIGLKLMGRFIRAFLFRIPALQ